MACGSRSFPICKAGLDCSHDRGNPGKLRGTQPCFRVNTSQTRRRCSLHITILTALLVTERDDSPGPLECGQRGHCFKRRGQINFISQAGSRRGAPRESLRGLRYGVNRNWAERQTIRARCCHRARFLELAAPFGHGALAVKTQTADRPGSAGGHNFCQPRCNVHR